MNGITAKDLATRLGGALVSGDGLRRLTGVSTPEHAGPSDLIFISSSKHSGALRASAAGAVLLAEDFETPEGMAVIRVVQPMLAMAQAVDLLVPVVRRPAGISPRAILGDHVEVAASASIGPGACIGDRTRVGDRTEIHAGVTLGADVIVGDDCIFYSGVHLYDGVRIGHRVILHAGAVIGADGFGFVREPLPPGGPADEPFRHRKLRQVGTVVIEDDVEIGANTTIDRATLSKTRIGRGTKIDNLVMVGHNSVIGRHSVIVSQAGLSGSVSLGDYATIAGQAGIIGHVHIGDHAVVGSQAGVTRDVPAHSTVLGAPAVDIKIACKALPIVAHLPELRRLVRTLEQRVAALEGDDTAGSE
jgi:UDP-3-O-[3-hydroxymyristoyl] glucosamine N-acyltransferase